MGHNRPRASPGPNLTNGERDLKELIVLFFTNYLLILHMTSFYILEISCQPGGARKGDYYIYNNLQDVKTALLRDIACGMGLHMLLKYGESIFIYVITDGQLVNKIDLHPYITIQQGKRIARFIEAIPDANHEHDRSREVCFTGSEKENLAVLNLELYSRDKLMSFAKEELNLLEKVVARAKTVYYDTWQKPGAFETKYQVAIANAIRIFRLFNRDIKFGYEPYYQDGDTWIKGLFSNAYSVNEKSSDDTSCHLISDDGKYTYSIRIDYPVISTLKGNIMQVPQKVESPPNDCSPEKKSTSDMVYPDYNPWKDVKKPVIEAVIRFPRGWDKFNPNVSPHATWLTEIEKANADPDNCYRVSYGHNNFE